MSIQEINFAEKPLLEHLRRGGSTSDPVGSELIRRFASTALQDTDVASICLRYAVDVDDVTVVYTAMIDALMPNPCINVKGPMLAPTAYFMEPERLHEVLAMIPPASREQDIEKRDFVIRGFCKVKAIGFWKTYSASHGVYPFRIQDRGGLESPDEFVTIARKRWVILTLLIAIVIAVAFALLT